MKAPYAGGHHSSYLNSNGSHTQQHLLFIVPLISGVDPDWARHHWGTHHAELVRGMPGLVRYRQNRLITSQWRKLRLLCSELWFASRDAQRDAFRGTYYYEKISPDERLFADVEKAWGTVVVDDSPASSSKYRVLGFSAHPIEESSKVQLLSRNKNQTKRLQDCFIYSSWFPTKQGAEIYSENWRFAMTTEPREFLIGNHSEEGRYDTDTAS